MVARRARRAVPWLEKDSRRIPRLCTHKGRGLAYVTDPRTGKEVYFGDAGTVEAAAAYAQWVKDFLAGIPSTLPTKPGPHLTVARLCLLYLEFAKDVLPQTRQADDRGGGTISQVLSRLNTRFGASRAVDFGPLNLKELRDAMAKEGLAREHINKQLHRVRRVWKWAVAEELLPPAALESLRAVSGLGKGRSVAPEEVPVDPVPMWVVEATLPFLSKRFAALVLFQLHGAMRPGEAVVCRPRDIDRSATPWIYRPHMYKTEHHESDRERIVYLGPKARAALTPLLRFCPSPSGWVWASRGRGPHAKKTGHLQVRSYAKAIGKAVEKANRMKPERTVPHWFPLQLRHSAATLIRQTSGLEAAQVLLGHSEMNTSEIYAEKNAQLGRSVAEEIG